MAYIGMCPTCQQHLECSDAEDPKKALAAHVEWCSRANGGDLGPPTYY